MAHFSNNSLVMQKSTAIGWGQTNSFPSWVCKHIITGVQFMTICGQTEYSFFFLLYYFIINELIFYFLVLCSPVFFPSQYIVKSPFILIQNVICSAFKHFSYIFTQSQLVIPRKIRVGLLKSKVSVYEGGKPGVFQKCYCCCYYKYFIPLLLV